MPLSEQRRFVTACSRANLEKQIGVIVRIVRDQMYEQSLLERLDVGVKPLALVVAHCAHFRVFAPANLDRGSEVPLRLFERAEILHNRFEPREFARQIPKAVGIR